jgi:hypothetical protein
VVVKSERSGGENTVSAGGALSSVRLSVALACAPAVVARTGI